MFRSCLNDPFAPITLQKRKEEKRRCHIKWQRLFHTYYACPIVIARHAAGYKSL